MKTLSKSPGIYLMKKDEDIYPAVRPYFGIWSHKEQGLIFDLSEGELTPLPELTEEQLFNIVGVAMKEYWESDIEDHREFLYSHINKLLRENNEPELREVIFNMASIETDIDKYLFGTDPADILIEIPQNNIISLSHKHRKK